MAAATLLERVRATIAGERLLEPGQGVLVLVSGGADSTLAAVALHELGYGVRLLHVEHGLRGRDSALDAAACRALAARLGRPIELADGRVPPGSNLEARLRDARRAAAQAAALGDPIATGHSADDRAETVLYRLAVSGTPAALTAMAPHEGAIIRPLIGLSAAEIRGELERRGLDWREDSSNRDPRFARNRIRGVVLPALAGVNAAAARNIARAAALADDERALLQALAGELVADDGSIALERLQAAPPALQRIALRAAAARAGLTLGHADVEALRGLGRAGSERRSVPGGWAERAYGDLRFERRGAAAPEAPEPGVLDVPGEREFGRWRVAATLGAGAAIDPVLIGRLGLRALAAGDRLPGRGRSCSELLQRARVPRGLRRPFPLVVVDGEPVCLPGIAVASSALRPRGVIVEATLRL